MGLQRLISFKQVKSSAVVVLLLQNTLLPVVREIVLAFLVQAEGQFLFLVYRANFRATKELEICIPTWKYVQIETRNIEAGPSKLTHSESWLIAVSHGNDQ